jgi:hypothetical protein
VLSLVVLKGILGVCGQEIVSKGIKISKGIKKGNSEKKGNKVRKVSNK